MMPEKLLSPEAQTFYDHQAQCAVCQHGPVLCPLGEGHLRTWASINLEAVNQLRRLSGHQSVLNALAPPWPAPRPIVN